MAMSGAATAAPVSTTASAKAATAGAAPAQHKDAKSEAKQPKPGTASAAVGGTAADGGFPWICGTCEFTNPGVVVRCVSCDSWNPEAPKGTPVKPATKPVGAASSAANAAANAAAAAANTSPALARFLPQAGDWTCPACDVTNKPEQKACRACTTPNPGCGGASAPVNAFAAAANGTAGSWECPVCEVPNPASAWECRACTTPNPNPPPRAAAPKFTGSNPMAGNPMAPAAASSSSDAKKQPQQDLTAMFGLNQSAGSSDVPAFDASAQFSFGSNSDAALGFAIGGDSDLKQALDASAAAAAAPAAVASASAAKPASNGATASSSTAASDALSPQSRVGRELQRWDGKFRLVGCTVPFRIAARDSAPASFVPAAPPASADTGPPAAGAAAAGAGAAAPGASASAGGLAAESLEFLLTNSGDGKEWIFPKGGWETDESATEGAARECYEEAGVRGSAVHALPIVEAAKKGGQMTRFFPFLFRVTELLDSWPEKHRPRRWVPYAHMQTTLSRDEMRQIWAHAVAAMAAGKHNAPDLPTTGFIPATGAGADGGAVLPTAAAAPAAPAASAAAAAAAAAAATAPAAAKK